MPCDECAILRTELEEARRERALLEQVLSSRTLRIEEELDHLRREVARYRALLIEPTDP